MAVRHKFWSKRVPVDRVFVPTEILTIALACSEDEDYLARASVLFDEVLARYKAVRLPFDRRVVHVYDRTYLKHFFSKTDNFYVAALGPFRGGGDEDPGYDRHRGFAFYCSLHRSNRMGAYRDVKDILRDDVKDLAHPEDLYSLDEFFYYPIKDWKRHKRYIAQRSAGN
jgi:hypothetical protein